MTVTFSNSPAFVKGSPAAKASASLRSSVSTIRMPPCPPVPSSLVTAPAQLPPVVNELHRATVDGRYFLTRQLAVGAAYWFDKYNVDDFALGPRDLASPATGTPSLLMFGYSYRPYTANTVSARITYLW